MCRRISWGLRHSRTALDERARRGALPIPALNPATSPPRPKPIGTGIISTAIKKQMASSDDIVARAVEIMTTLNATESEVMKRSNTIQGLYGRLRRTNRRRFAHSGESRQG